MPYASGPYAGVPYAAVAATSARALPRAARCPQFLRGDYVRDANGDLVEGDPEMEEVIFLLSTIPDTFVSPDGEQRGNSVVSLRAFTDDSVVQVQDRVRRALKTATDRGSIRNVEVVPSPSTRNGLATLEYLVSYEKTGRV